MIAGRYTLEREVGRGGTGAVWLGRDEVLGRQVALKRIGLLPGADQTDLARAEREARLSAALHHPHVVSVFDVVDAGEEHGREGRWLVMEYVEGTDLAGLVRERGPLSPDQAAPLVRQVADALVAAHAAGIVHRDVKPSNVLVDAHDWVRITDFGIARMHTDPALTQTGMVTGSPAYLAPEVVTGGRGAEPADVWSLGATLYHLLTGRPPYDVGDNVIGALYQIVNDPPPAIDAGWLSPLVEGALVKDPDQRWTMTQVRDFLDDRSTPAPAPAPSEATAVVAPPPSAASPASRRRRDPVVLALAALVLLGLAAVAFVLGRELTDDGEPAAAPSSSPSPAPTSAPTSASPSPSPSTTSASSASPAPEPATAAGMEAFIEDYVTAVGEDPSASWEMLTPNFQRQSGGFETYEEFWEDAENGRVVEFVDVDPDALRIAYQVRYDNFDNGPGPTVLQLELDDGEYRIDGESSAGFVPAE